MATSQKAKGPAEAATSPDHGSANSPEGKIMNACSHTTTAEDQTSFDGRCHMELCDDLVALLRVCRSAAGSLDPDLSRTIELGVAYASQIGETMSMLARSGRI